LHALRKAGYELLYERVWTGPGCRQRLKNNHGNRHFGLRNAWFWRVRGVELLKASGQDVPFILVSAVVSEETAVAA